jgi:uncharacterized protein (UPF0276 family)
MDNIPITYNEKHEEINLIKQIAGNSGCNTHEEINVIKQIAGNSGCNTHEEINVIKQIAGNSGCNTHEDINVIKQIAGNSGCNTHDIMTTNIRYKDLKNRFNEDNMLERKYWARFTFFNENICMHYLRDISIQHSSGSVQS